MSKGKKRRVKKGVRQDEDQKMYKTEEVGGEEKCTSWQQPQAISDVPRLRLLLPRRLSLLLLPIGHGLLVRNVVVVTDVVLWRWYRRPSSSNTAIGVLETAERRRRAALLLPRGRRSWLRLLLIRAIRTAVWRLGTPASSRRVVVMVMSVVLVQMRLRAIVRHPRRPLRRPVDGAAWVSRAAA